VGVLHKVVEVLGVEPGLQGGVCWGLVPMGYVDIAVVVVDIEGARPRVAS